MNKSIKIITPIIVIVGSFMFVQALIAGKPDPEKKEEEQRLVSLYVDEVKSEEITLSVSTQGVVAPKTAIDIISQVSGQVVSVSDTYAEGAEFDESSVLIKIDDTDYKLAVIRAEARVAEAEVSVQREQANAKIKKQQWNAKNKNTQPTEYALNIPQVAEAKAKLLSAKADLREARLNVERTEIKVPFKGRVDEKLVAKGQYISAGTNLGRVFSTDVAEIRLPLTDTQLVELNLPMGFMALTDVEKNSAPLVQFSSMIGQKKHTWTGRIVRTNASVDQQTRLIYAIAQVEDPYGKGSDAGTPLAMGLFVTAEIEGVNSQQAFVMPRMALRNADKVYVVNEESKLEIRTVKVLSSNDEQVFVTAGVEAGEKVVTSTIPAAVDGMLVQAIERTQDALVTQL